MGYPAGYSISFRPLTTTSTTTSIVTSKASKTIKTTRAKGEKKKDKVILSYKINSTNRVRKAISYNIREYIDVYNISRKDLLYS